MVDTVTCTCIPCTTPAYGAPGHAHCAACCAGSLIADYDHYCPVPEHRRMAALQHGPLIAAIPADRPECDPVHCPPTRHGHSGVPDTASFHKKP